MTSNDQRRSDEQREERNHQDRLRADRDRERRRVEQLRLDAEYKRNLLDRQTARDTQARREADALRTRTNAILSDPNSFFGGQLPPATPFKSTKRHSFQPPSLPITYPSAPIELLAWQEHRHPELASILIEVMPLPGGGV